MHRTREANDERLTTHHSEDHPSMHHKGIFHHIFFCFFLCLSFAG